MQPKSATAAAPTLTFRLWIPEKIRMNVALGILSSSPKKMTTSRLEWNGSEFERNNNNVNKRFDITERDEMQLMWGRTEKTMAGQNHLWLEQRYSPKVQGALGLFLCRRFRSGEELIMTPESALPRMFHDSTRS
jgi:hypothetical protein